MQVIELVTSMRDTCNSLRKNGKRIRLVPTMGALHAGHGSLIESARRSDVPIDAFSVRGDLANGRANNRKQDEGEVVVVVSIFVNPIQFSDPNDLKYYPKTLDKDLDFCKSLGVDYVFVPTLEQMYPDFPQSGSSCRVVPPTRLARELEGKSRAGHFEGMLTVVCKLLNLIGPNEVYFGEKDYQQLVLVRKMVNDLDMNVNVCAVPTVRDSDLLPLSSRNIKLNTDQREIATLMYDILTQAKDSIPIRTIKSSHTDSGCRHDNLHEIILASMLTTLCISLDKDSSKFIHVDYLELRCAKDLSEIYHNHDIQAYDCRDGCVANSGIGTLRARLLTSVIVDGIRLLDNIEVILNNSE